MYRTEPPVTIRACQGPSEYPELIDIWRGAVRATHNFLEDSDFDRIERNLASAYFPSVSLLVAKHKNHTLGFAGVAAGSLEMLFVSAASHGHGIGSALLTEAIAHHGVTKVDVNEQNPEAHAFYTRRGFAPVGRSELDSDGRPYPILHLELTSRSSRRNFVRHAPDQPGLE